MKFSKTSDDYVIRLEKGEDIIETIASFCQKENITTAFFTGLGSMLSAQIGYYDLESKIYNFKSLSKVHEIVSLTGNVSLVDGAPFVHLHCVLSNKDLQCFGGHLKEGVVGATCEIHLRKFDLSLERKFDEKIGLKLLDCRA